MRVFYGCITGAHFSRIAAGIHLGKFDTREGIWHNSPCLAAYNWRQVDQVRFRGVDERGREVYTLGTAFNSSVFNHAIRDLFALYGYTSQDYHYVDTSACGGFMGRLGCWMTGFSGLENLGSRLLARSMYTGWEGVNQLVADTKRYLDSISEVD